MCSLSTSSVNNSEWPKQADIAGVKLRTELVLLREWGAKLSSMAALWRWQRATNRAERPKKLVCFLSAFEVLIAPRTARKRPIKTENKKKHNRRPIPRFSLEGGEKNSLHREKEEKKKKARTTEEQTHETEWVPSVSHKAKAQKPKHQSEPTTADRVGQIVLLGIMRYGSCDQRWQGWNLGNTLL